MSKVDRIPLEGVHKNKYLINNENLKPGDKVSCINDTTFKMLILNSQDPRMAAKMISVFYDIDYESVYKELTFDKTEHDRVSLDQPTKISDGLLCFRGNKILVENNGKENEERNIFYLDLLFRSTVSYKNRRQYLSSAWLINFNRFWYSNTEESIEVYMMQNKKKKLLTFCKQVVNVFIPLIVKKWYDKEELDEKEIFTLIVFINDAKVARELAKGDEVYMDFIERSVELAQDEKIIRDIYEENQEEEYREFYRRIGVTEGIEQGQELATQSFIENLFLKGKNEYEISDTLGIPIDKVKKVLLEFDN